LQFREATSERINAESAYQEAEVAKLASEAAQERGESAADAANQARQEAEEVRNALRDALLSVVKFVYLQVETKGDFGGERLSAALDEIEKDLNKILRAAIPDPSERKQFIESLRLIIPPRDDNE